MSEGIFKNLWLKLASIGLAAILWAAVVIIGHNTVSVEIPVNYKNLEPGVLVSGGEGRTVTLSLKGHERFLQGLGPENITLELDMKGYSVGRHSYEVDADDIDHPATVRVIRVKPALLNIRLDELKSREIPVRAIVTGIPMRGFAVRGVEVVPGVVKVEGPAGVIKRLKRLDAGPVDISGATGDVAEEVLVNAGPEITLIEDSVKIKVIIGKK
jgi:YbbR domain-containing protein